jgi:hypothetical protein
MRCRAGFNPPNGLIARQPCGCTCTLWRVKTRPTILKRFLKAFKSFQKAFLLWFAHLESLFNLKKLDFRLAIGYISSNIAATLSTRKGNAQPWRLFFACRFRKVGIYKGLY